MGYGLTRLCRAASRMRASMGNPKAPRLPVLPTTDVQTLLLASPRIVLLNGASLQWTAELWPSNGFGGHGQITNTFRRARYLTFVPYDILHSSYDSRASSGLHQDLAMSSRQLWVGARRWLWDGRLPRRAVMAAARRKLEGDRGLSPAHPTHTVIV